MKKLMLMGMLLCASFAFAQDGGASSAVVVMDESSLFVRAIGTDAGAVADAGEVAVDAGTKLVVGDEIDIVGIAKKAGETGHSKSWSVMFIIVSILVVLTWGVRKFGGMFIPFLKTDRGGAITVLVLGFLGGLLNALAMKDALTLNIVVEGFVFSIMSAGGFNVVKKLIFPSDPKPENGDSGPKPA